MLPFSIHFHESKIDILYHNEPFRSFKAHVLKPFVRDIIQLQTREGFEDIEKKAIKRYLFFLLSKKDQLSNELLSKAKLSGFRSELIVPIIQDCIDKGYVNDEALKLKKALKKVKNGYAIGNSREFGTHLEDAKILEKDALNKLFAKKGDLLVSKDLKLKQKGYRFFLSRGYSIDQINQLISTYGDTL